MSKYKIQFFPVVEFTHFHYKEALSVRRVMSHVFESECVCLMSRVREGIMPFNSGIRAREIRSR